MQSALLRKERDGEENPDLDMLPKTFLTNQKRNVHDRKEASFSEGRTFDR